jgi:hypothetical protein
MDVHKRSTQIERLEVGDTGRRRRWSNVASPSTPALRPRWRSTFLKGSALLGRRAFRGRPQDAARLTPWLTVSL